MSGGILATGDIHMSDRPKDAYRLGLFDWLAAQQKKYKTSATFILGDLTVFKDRHPAALVNAIVEGLCKLKPPVYIDMGNHDYISETSPFFNFVNNIEGLYFIRRPKIVTVENLRFLVIPHMKDGWPDFAKFGKPDYAFVHQTVDGAVSESGMKLRGLPSAPIAAIGAKKVFGGDVHRPQRIGPVNYIGPPYSITFADDFDAGVLLLEPNGKETRLHYPCLKKWLIKINDLEGLDKFRVVPGDQVKVIMTLTREEVYDWPQIRASIREWCKRAEVEVFGIELVTVGTEKKPREKAKPDAGVAPSDWVSRFCDHERIDTEKREVGLTLLRDDV